MRRRGKWRKFLDKAIVEWALFIIGVLLLIVSPLVGAIPGPGGIFVAGVGLALVLKTSTRAKRHYVRVKRRQPKAGRLMDRALRRRSPQHRDGLRKAAELPARN